MKNASPFVRSRRRIVPPKGLSPEAQELFRELAGVYNITDPGGRQVLKSGLISLDTAVSVEAVIKRDGPVFSDRFGQPRPHPLLAAARDHRQAWLAALRQLNLAIGDPTRPGRPEGS